jgi:hypothetical protein
MGKVLKFPPQVTAGLAIPEIDTKVTPVHASVALVH